MFSLPLYKQGVRSHYKILILFLLILSMYFSVIVTMFDPALGQLLNQMVESMPQVMGMFGMHHAGTTLIGFLVNYLYGFLMLIFPLLYAVIASNRLVARHVDRGSMAYLLASPNSRLRVVMTQMIVLLSGLTFLIVFCTVVGIVCSELWFPDELDIGRFILVNAGVYCLHLAISGLCFLASCVSNESKYAVAVGAGFPLFFYLVQMLANMGGKLEKLKYATFFTLFDPAVLATGDAGAMIGCVFLAATGILLYTAGCIIFCKRDLPL